MKCGLLLIVLFCVLVFAQSPPSPPTINGIRAAFTVGAIEDLQVPGAVFGIDAVRNILGFGTTYSDIINELYEPAVAWWLYRFGVDFTNAVEVSYPGSGVFYNGYATASPIAIDETYRVMASNIPVFNTLFPPKVYSIQYVVTFNATVINSMYPTLYYNGTYGNPGGSAPTPRIPILAGYPFFNEGLFWGFHIVSTYLSNELIEDTINTQCNSSYIPMPKKELMKKVLDICPPPCPCKPPCPPPSPSSQVNFTFYDRSYDPAVAFPYYADPFRILERRQMCSPDFGPGSAVFDSAVAAFGPVNGTFPLYLESAWVFPMNYSTATLSELFAWNDCGCCQGCVPLTSFPPLTNPPATSSATSGDSVFERRYHNQEGGGKRLDGMELMKLKRRR